MNIEKFIIGTGVINIVAKTDSLTNSLKKITGEIQAGKIGIDLGTQIAAGIGKGLMGAGAIITTAVGYGVKQAIDVEKEMSVVKSLAYNTDKAKMNADINGVAQFARNTAISSPFSQIENLQMGQDLLRLGLSGTDIDKIGKNMIDTTVAIGEKAPAQVAEAIVSYTKIWDKNTEEANHFGDVITKAMNTTALGFSDYQDAMSYVASTSAKYGMKIEETTALLGSIADKGLKGSSAGTGLSAVMTNTYAANKRSKEALSIMGISAYDNTGKQRNFIDILGEMQKKYAKLNDEQKNQVSLYLAGKEHLKSFDKIMQTNVETIKENIKALEQSNGESERQAKENQKNFAMQSKILKNNIQVLAGEASKTLLPILNDMLQKLIGKLQQLNAWWDKLSDSKKEGIVKTITGLAIGLTTLGGALSISGKVMTLVTTFKTLSTAISGVGGALKIIPLLTNPVGLAIAGIGLVAFLVIKNWEKVKNFFSKFWTGTKNLFNSNVGNILTILFPFIGLPVKIISNWDKIKGSFSNIFGHIKTGAKNLVNTVTTDFKNASWGEKLVWTLNPFTYLIEKVIKKNIKATKEAWESFVNTVENLKEKVIAPFRAIAEWIQRILEKWNNFKSNFSLPQINIPFVGNVGGGSSKESSKTTNVTINNKNNISNNYDYNKFNTQTQRDIRRGLFAW